MGEIGRERWELWYVFSIHQVKPAAVNEGLRWQSKTKNEERVQQWEGRYLFILARERLGTSTSVNKQSNGEKHSLIVDINHNYTTALHCNFRYKSSCNKEN